MWSHRIPTGRDQRGTGEEAEGGREGRGVVKVLFFSTRKKITIEIILVLKVMGLVEDKNLRESSTRVVVVVVVVAVVIAVAVAVVVAVIVVNSSSSSSSSS